MKRLLILLLTVIMLCVFLGSCDLSSLMPGGQQSEGTGENDGNGTNGGGEGEKEEKDPEGFIWGDGSELYFVYDPASVPEEIVFTVTEAFGNRSIFIQPYSKDSAPKPHEIVIGNVGREVSDSAYVQLNRIDKNSPSDVRYCIYSNGSSVAIAYDECDGDYSLEAVLDIFINDYIDSQLTLNKGTYEKTSLDIYSYLGEKDSEKYGEMWQALSEKLGPEGSDVIAALKALYTIYDGEGLTKWVANLYDPDICVCKGFYGEEECSNTQWCHTGGFYFSNSGRDTVGFLPDIESTLQGLNLINSLGIADTDGGYHKLLPEWMSEQIVAFTLSLQDPDGYFYHPQWGKAINTSRRGRDLTWSMNILKRYGVDPKYDTIYDASAEEAMSLSPLTGRFGNSSVSMVSKVIATESETLIPDYLKTPEAFRTFLEAQDIRNNSYSVGSNLSATGDQIVARGPEYGEILISWLNENQYENGTWHHTLGYDAINGVMKITGSYSRWKAEMPRADKTCLAAFASIDTDEKADGIVDVWNAWVAVTNVLSNIENYAEDGKTKAAEIRASLMPSLDEAILATREKLTVFLKPDGSMVYQASGKTSGNSMGQSVAVPGTDEGDLNATLIGTCNMTSYIFSFMKLSSYEVPMAGLKERAMFLDIVNNLPPVNKTGGSTEIPDPYGFDDEEVGDAPLDVYNAGTDAANLLVTRDPRGSGNVIQLQSVPGKGDSIVVSASGPLKNLTGIVFETDMCINSASVGDATFRLEIGDGGDSKNLYRISFKTSGGGVEMYDCSANDAKKRLTNSLETLEYGRWYKLRVEAYLGDHNSFRAKVYLDGKLLAISDNYYDNTGAKLGGVGTPNSTINNTRFYVLNGSQLDMMVDNVLCYKNTTPYSFEPLHEDYRYLPGAINVDNYSEEGVVYDLEDSTEFPREFSVTGNATVESEGGNNYAKITNNSSLAVPYIKRAKEVNHSVVSFRILPGNYSEGDAAVISFAESSVGGNELFKLSLKAVLDGGKLRFRLYDANGELEGIDIPTDKAATVKIAYFESVDTALVYVDGERVGSFRNKTIYSFGKAIFSSVGTVAIDDIVVERASLDFNEATKPKNDGKVYGFDQGLEGITTSGTASVSGSKLNLRGNASGSEIKVPVYNRDTVVSYSEFGFELAFTAVPSNGVTHKISLTDENGNVVIAFTLKSDRGVVGIYETTGGKVYENPITTFSATSANVLGFEYYENDAICKVYLNGKLVFATALVYSPESTSYTPAFLSIKAQGANSSVTLDQVYFDRYSKLFVKESYQTSSEKEEVAGFEKLGANDLPSGFTSTLFSAAPDMRVVEMNKDGEYSKVLRFETLPGAKQDNLSIRPTKTVTSPKSFVFNCEFMFSEARNSATYQLDFWSGGSKNIELNVTVKSDGFVYFRQQDHTTKEFFEVKVAALGEWFNMRVEYYAAYENGVTVPRLKVFVNDELLYVTDYRLSDTVITNVDYVSFHSLIAADALIYLDNVSFEYSNTAYDGSPITPGFAEGESKNTN